LRDGMEIEHFSDHIRCPHCHNIIEDDEALLCLFCGESLKRGIGFLGKLRRGAPEAVFGAVVLLLVISFLLLLIF